MPYLTTTTLQTLLGRSYWRVRFLPDRIKISAWQYSCPPKFSAVQEHCPPEKPFASRYSPFAVVFGSAKASPSQTPNEFGAQKKIVINHWLKPVAWVILEHSWEPFKIACQVGHACLDCPFVNSQKWVSVQFRFGLLFYFWDNQNGRSIGQRQRLF